MPPVADRSVERPKGDPRMLIKDASVARRYADLGEGAMHCAVMTESEELCAFLSSTASTCVSCSPSLFPDVAFQYHASACSCMPSPCFMSGETVLLSRGIEQYRYPLHRRPCLFLLSHWMGMSGQQGMRIHTMVEHCILSAFFPWELHRSYLDIKCLSSLLRFISQCDDRRSVRQHPKSPS